MGSGSVPGAGARHRRLGDAGAPNATLQAIVVLFVVVAVLVGPSFALVFTLQRRHLLHAEPAGSLAADPAHPKPPGSTPPLGGPVP